MSRSFSRSALVVLLVLVVFGGCVDETPSISAPDSEPRLSTSELPIDAITENPVSLAVARQVPSFGGLFFDDHGELVVALTDASGRAHAEAIIRSRLGSHQTARGTVDRKSARFTSRAVQYSFLDLARYKMMLRKEVTTIPGVVSLDVKESENRVKIGLADPGAQGSVVGVLSKLGIPRAAVAFWHVPYATDAAHTLAGAMGGIQGGWQISNSFGALCTLGFAARRQSDWSPVFVTNSHCTTTPHALDFTGPFTQNGTPIGSELADPAAINMNGALYRSSDAALISASVALQFGTIARTTNSSGCESCSNQTTILHANPAIQITGRKGYVIENETLHKIGRTTGWTFGNVEDSCSDFFSSGWWKWCSDRVDFSIEDGDSGSPVFALKGDGTAELRGIVFSKISFPYSDAMMSNLGQIEADLGQLVVYDPGPPTVVIAGPTQVEAGAICTWDSQYSGLAPFTDQQWSGLLNATTWSVQGSLSNSGYLQFSVKDRLGRLGYTTIFVTVQGVSQTEFCPEG